MSWWGKLFGGAVGFTLGGPLGALLGAALGHSLDRHLHTQLPRPDLAQHGDEGATQSAFFTATFSIMGHIAKADGRVTPDEIALATRVMQQMSLPAPMRTLARSLFAQGKSPDFPLDAVLAQLRGQTRSRNLLRMFLEIQVFAAYVDGRLHARERGILEQICTALGFDARTLAQIEQLVQAELAHEFSDATPGRSPEKALMDAYALLGVDPDADDADVKRAYRRAMSQHHPDKLVSRGLPEEMMKMATARTQEIKAAYDFIRSSRRGAAA